MPTRRVTDRTIHRGRVTSEIQSRMVTELVLAAMNQILRAASRKKPTERSRNSRPLTVKVDGPRVLAVFWAMKLVSGGSLERATRLCVPGGPLVASAAV